MAPESKSFAAFGFVFILLVLSIFGIGCGGNGSVAGPTPTPTPATPTPTPATPTPTPATPTPTPIPTPVAPKFLYALADNGSANSDVIYGFSVNPADGSLAALSGSPFGPITGTSPTVAAPELMCGNNNLLYIPDGTALSGFRIDQVSGALAIISSASVGGFTQIKNCVLTPDGRFLYAPDFGLQEIFGFSVASDGGLIPLAGSPFAPGSVSKQLNFGSAVSPNSRFLVVGLTPGLLVFNVDVLAIDNSGGLSEIPGDLFGAARAMNVAIDPLGRFVYVGEGDLPDAHIAAFSMNSSTGMLASVPGSPFEILPITVNNAGGQFGFDLLGKFVYVPDLSTAGKISAFAIDGNSGALSELPGSPLGAGYRSPFASVIDPSNKFYYTAESDGLTGNIFVFDFDSSTGSLTPASPASVNVGAATNIFSVLITH